MSSGVASDPKDSKFFFLTEESLFKNSIWISYMRWNRDSYLSENPNDIGGVNSYEGRRKDKTDYWSKLEFETYVINLTSSG